MALIKINCKKSIEKYTHLVEKHKERLMRNLLTLGICILISASSFASTNFDHSHKSWTNILSQNVSQSLNTTVVNYNALKDTPRPLIDYLDSLEKVSKKDFQLFTSNQQLAFLINAYNAYTIKLIVENYPIKSIKDIGGIFSSPWKKKFIHLYGEVQNLDNIEHELIRKNFKEARIHFALVCASIGCPSLRNEAFVADKLNEQLEDSAIRFLSDPQRNRYDKATKTLELSSIFDWYGEDFIKYNGSLNAFIATKITSDKSDQMLIQNKNVKIKFLDYNWNLNKK
jgi:hypothetical protein